MSFDDFLRTGVELLWRRCAAAGDFYRRELPGRYCAGSEQFWASGDLAGAWSDAEAGLAHAGRFGEGIVVPRLLGVAGEVARRRGEDPEPAWARAAALAKEQGTTLP